MAATGTPPYGTKMLLATTSKFFTIHDRIKQGTSSNRKFSLPLPVKNLIQDLGLLGNIELNLVALQTVEKLLFHQCSKGKESHLSIFKLYILGIFL